MKCMKRVVSSLVALVMITNVAFGWTVTVSNGIYSIERTGMIDGKTVTVKADKTAGAEFEVKKGNITLNQAIPGMPLADFTMPAEDVEIGIVTTPVNKPVLGEGMIPVNWDDDEEDWVDTTEASWEWDYGSVAPEESNGELEGYRVGKWANARTPDGSMYVWIPRFSYKIVSGENQTVKSWNSDLIDGSEGTVGKIEIKFSEGAADDLSDDFIVHPAFNFAGNEMSGFWVAKFEASRDDATDTDEGVGTIPMSVPGVKSWRSSSASEMYTSALNMNSTLSSHMMKNSEWGAVAYLTNAIGRTPYINNDENHITGRTAEAQNSANTSGNYWLPVEDWGTTAASAAYDWNTGEGTKGSTTHNIYGVYDMSGGTHETVAAIYLNGNSTYLADDTDNIYAGALYEARDTQYVDVYTEYSDAIYGDAIYETSASNANEDLTAWDGGRSAFMAWGAVAIRGGDNSSYTSAGIYSSASSDGDANRGYGFRVVLLPAEAAATTGPNAPVLADGMIPLNWDGDKWVDVTEETWEYNYDSVASAPSNGSILGNGSGQWANARLADGSIYVWIPRYSYKITSGENKNVISWNSDSITGEEEEVGRVKIRWSSGIHDFVSDGYIAHPAFNYAQYLGGDTSDPNNYNTNTEGGVTPLTDEDKLDGFWVAKYEASRSDSIIAGEQKLLKVNTSTGITTYRYEASGDMIEVTAAPMDGYEFVGWSIVGATASDLSQSTITFMMPNNDVTATANFRKTNAADVTVSFNSNGGSAVSVKVVSVGNAYGELSIPAKSGYTFGGWFKEEALTNKVTSSTIVTTETDHTLYASWGLSNYTVSFDTDGGNAVSNKTVTFSQTYGTLPTPVKDGYIFDGWYKEAELTNAVTSSTTVTATGDHTLYVKWLTAYNVTFNSKGGSAVDGIKVAYGKAYGTLQTPTRENYTFLGWYKEETLQNAVTSSSVVSTESDHTLYAKWQINGVTVTLDQQGGSGGTGTVNALYGSAMPAITVPTKTGYTFGGYYTETNAGGTQYYKADGTSAKNWDKTTATTLYAKWTINSYTITASAGDGGSISPSGTTTVNYGESKSFTITGNTGYAISSVTVDGTNLGVVTTVDFTNVTGNHTIVAAFTQIAATDFAYNGGSQTYTAPLKGVYKLEVWGAGGKNDGGTGGNGGYSVGYIRLEENDTLYVTIGGAGSGSYYNGGGEYGGGGATHIATVSGTIASIGAANLNKILIIAGGGGRGGYKSEDLVTKYYNGGAGGGTSGGNAGDGDATGGTQTSGYKFGQGYHGGGGGLYGGNQTNHSGAGGSGYIGGVPSFEYNGTTYSASTSTGSGCGANTNGKAKISFVASIADNYTFIEPRIYACTGGVQEFIAPKAGLYSLECFGAGGKNSNGGAGGYSKGYVQLTEGQTLYVVVGGSGSATHYNGGGSSGGGGATHIAKVSGTLESIGSANLGQILLIAGGGGGGSSKTEDLVTKYYNGGAGGGLSGGNAADGVAGGTQTSGYAFGKGNHSGGGGLYGGNQETYSGSGGSGYIGGVPEITYNGKTYSPVTTAGAGSAAGDGKVIISFIE